MEGAVDMLTQGKGQFWRLSELVAQNSEAQTGCPITYIYSKSEFRDLLQRRGFQVEKMQVDHIFPYRIPDYVQYRYVEGVVLPLDAPAPVPLAGAELRLALVCHRESALMWKVPDKPC